MRVNEDKKKISFSGPFYGPTSNTQEDADDGAKQLTNEAKGGAVVAKVFRISSGDSIAYAMETARPIFYRIQRDVLEAKQVLDRPMPKKCKRRG
jgi:hypothetical protein